MAANSGNIDSKMEKPIEKKKPTTPWKPAASLDVKGKKDGYRYRFSTQNKVNRREMEGWEVAKQGDGECVHHGPIDGKGIGGEVRKNELVLMRIPEEIAKERDAYYQQRTNDQIRSTGKEYKNAVPSGLAYGKMTVNIGED